MTVEEFNSKYINYLEESFYGLAISTPEVVEYLDKLFEVLTKIPGFKYFQIKMKWGQATVYLNDSNRILQPMISKEINEIHKKLEE